MLYRLLVILSIFISGSAAANSFPVEIIDYMENSRVVFSLYEKDLRTAGQWEPHKNAQPPVTVAEAIKLMKAYASTKTELTDLTLQEIELKPIPHHKQQWHYLLKVKASLDGKIRRHYFVVLMNAKVLEGIEEPDAVK